MNDSSPTICVRVEYEARVHWIYCTSGAMVAVIATDLLEAIYYMVKQVNKRSPPPCPLHPFAPPSIPPPSIPSTPATLLPHYSDHSTISTRTYPGCPQPSNQEFFEYYLGIVVSLAICVSFVLGDQNPNQNPYPYP